MQAVSIITVSYTHLDDILIVWEGEVNEFKKFTEELNNVEKTIKFQEEIGGLEINFLDINIKIEDNKLKFDIYRKETYSDLIIPQESYHPCLLYTSRCV